MAIFFLVEIEEITDPDKYSQYIQAVSPLIKAHGGKYIVRSEKLKPLSGNWQAKRIIMIQFDSEENLRNCLTSDEYKKIAPLREESTVSQSVIIEQ